MPKRKVKPKRKSLVEAERKLAKTLAKVGYTGLKESGLKSLRPPFPNKENSQ